MSFQPPRKAILTPDQLAHFQKSKTYQDIVGFIEDLNERVVGVKLTDEIPISPVRKSSQMPFQAFLGLTVWAVAE